MTLLQAKGFGLTVLAGWNAKETVWQVSFRLSNGERVVRYFRRKYRATDFASMVLGATVNEVARGNVAFTE